MLTKVTGLRRWKPFGWGSGPVRFKPWDEAADWLSTLSASYPALKPHLDIVESVIIADAQHRLGLITSMTDLIVFHRATGEPPYDPVFVNILPVTSGKEAWVRIWHCSFTGHDDRIDVPPAKAVAAFWRFMHYKFDVLPKRLGVGVRGVIS